ncbi:hypothetical protein QQ045_027674 [Rhodiola kirilowii]
MAELMIQPNRHHHQLMQNCDLPPPTKLYLGCFDNPIYTPNPNNILENNLARALNLSQARAREAERRMEEAVKERAFAINALLSESMRVMAYRRWLMMLEIQFEKLRLNKAEEDVTETRRTFLRNVAEDEDTDDDVDVGVEKWKMGLLICLGLAGLRLAYRFGFLRK